MLNYFYSSFQNQLYRLILKANVLILSGTCYDIPPVNIVISYHIPCKFNPIFKKRANLSRAPDEVVVPGPSLIKLN